MIESPPSLWGALFHPWTWRMAWRDSRTQRGRLLVFSFSIIAGIAALVAIHSLKASMEAGVASQAKALLGSDLEVTSRHAFPEPARARLSAQARQVSLEISFSSMLFFPSANAARLVQVRGFEGAYPFYGTVTTAPADAWQRIHHEPGIVLEPALLDQFHAKIGDRVRLGSVELPILGTIVKPLPRSSRFGGFAPEAYVPIDQLERTGLLGTSSLSSHHLHLQIDPELAPGLKSEFAEQGWKFETAEDRRDALGKTLENFERFLGLVALVALILGAIGVASAVYAHVNRRIGTVATLRCLGCPVSMAFGIYLVQAFALGLVGAILGAACGIGLHFGILTFFQESIPIAVEAAPRWLVVGETTLAGFSVCCGFAILPLLRIRDISPAAALRESFERSSLQRGHLAWIIVLVGLLITGMNRLSGEPWRRAFLLTAGLSIAFALLVALGAALSGITRKLLRPSWPYLLRQGISNLYRPHNQTLLFLLSLGLGSFLLLTILLSKNLLLEKLTVAKSSDGPNIYLVDVQRDQIDGVSALLRSMDLPQLESAPMVTMRIKSVKGVPIAELAGRKDDSAEKKGVPKWVLQREFRSTYREQLTASEKMIAGGWWEQVPAEAGGPAPLSLEEDIAKA